MKTLWKSFLMITAIALFASCGGNQGTQEEATSEETTAEASTETMEAAAPGLAAGTYTIAADSSNALKWTGTHIGKSYEHYGRIMLSSGSFTVADGNITGGSLEIDMTSITVDDITDDAEKNAKLVGHLSDADFFSVEQFPSATFTIKNVEAISGGDGTHTITGDLTVKGVTEEISFPVTVSAEGNMAMIKGTMTFDRTKFGVSYNSGSLEDVIKENIISDDVELEFNLTATM